MNNNLRANLAEGIGSFFFVFFTAGVACAVHLHTEPRLDVTSIALASGLTLAVALTATFPMSIGCLNPAITLTLWVFKRLDGRRMATLVAMQLVGALLAGLVIQFCFDPDMLRTSHAGTPHLTERVYVEGKVAVASLLSGLGIEVVLTCLLTLAVLTTLFDPRAPKAGGFAVGMAQVAVVMLGYRLTGGSANPARWFGTVVWEMTLNTGPPSPLVDHAVYWAGPILGALLAGLLYSAVFAPPEKR